MRNYYLDERKKKLIKRKKRCRCWKNNLLGKEKELDKINKELLEDIASSWDFETTHFNLNK